MKYFEEVPKLLDEAEKLLTTAYQINEALKEIDEKLSVLGLDTGSKRLYEYLFETIIVDRSLKVRDLQYQTSQVNFDIMKLKLETILNSDWPNIKPNEIAYRIINYSNGYALEKRFYEYHGWSATLKTITEKTYSTLEEAQIAYMLKLMNKVNL